MKRTNPWANHAILMALSILCLTFLNLVVQADPTDLQTDLKDLEVGGDWLYGDLDKGIALAKDSGKPLFVLFR